MAYKVGSFFILIRGKMKGSNHEWLISGVYGPTDYTPRTAFFEELGSIKQSWLGLWCLRGEFNEVRESK